MVSFKGRTAFYARNSAGKYPLDVEQLRTAFALSQTTRERIRDFRADRIAQIAAGETPIKLAGTSIVLLHVLPLSSFESDRSLQSRELEKAFPPGIVLPAYGLNGAYASRFNFDGFVSYHMESQHDVTSYLQVFRNGVIESACTEPMWNENQQMSLKSAFFEGHLIRSSLPKYLNALRTLLVPPPLFVGVSLIGLERFTMFLPPRLAYTERRYMFGRRILIVPPIMLETYETNLSTAMRPIFEAVWNAAGRAESPYYNGNEWQGLRKFNQHPNAPEY